MKTASIPKTAIKAISVVKEQNNKPFDPSTILPLCFIQDVPLVFEGTDYTKLIWKEALKHHAKTGRDIKDIFQEASLKFVLTCNTWKKREGENTVKFSTFLSQNIGFQFINEGIKYRDKVQAVREASIEYSYYFQITHTSEEDPVDSVSFRRGLEKLSADAKEVVKVVFDSPEEMARLSKASIRRFFSKIGWSNKRTDSAFTEISSMLAS